MKKFLVALFALAAALAFSPAAKADTYWQFSFSNDGSVGNNPSILPYISGSGVFDVNPAGQVIGMWGTAFNLTPASPVEAMTLNAPGTPFSNDNRFSPSGPQYFSMGGLVFTADGQQYNLAFWDGYLLIATAYDGSTYTPINFSDSPTVAPEPSSLLLLGTGLIGFAGFLRRKLRA